MKLFLIIPLVLAGLNAHAKEQPKKDHTATWKLAIAGGLGTASTPMVISGHAMEKEYQSAQKIRNEKLNTYSAREGDRLTGPRLPESKGTSFTEFDYRGRAYSLINRSQPTMLTEAHINKIMNAYDKGLLTLIFTEPNVPNGDRPAQKAKLAPLTTSRGEIISERKAFEKELNILRAKKIAVYDVQFKTVRNLGPDFKFNRNLKRGGLIGLAASAALVAETGIEAAVSSSKDQRPTARLQVHGAQ